MRPLWLNGMARAIGASALEQQPSTTLLSKTEEQTQQIKATGSEPATNATADAEPSTSQRKELQQFKQEQKAKT